MLQFTASDIWKGKLSPEVARRAQSAKRELEKEKSDVLPSAQEIKQASD